MSPHPVKSQLLRQVELILFKGRYMAYDTPEDDLSPIGICATITGLSRLDLRGRKWNDKG